MRCTRFVFVALLVALASSVSAQTVVTPASKLQWDIVGETAAIAQATGVNFYLDTAAGVPLAGVTCVNSATAGTATCTAPLPALTPGTHSIVLTQIVGTAESAKSSPLSVQFIVVVTPTGLRIA